MQSRKERGQQIRQQILRDVIHHPNDITKHISSIFSISPQAVNNHIRKLEKSNQLDSEGRGRGKVYSLGEVRTESESFELSSDLSEDLIWRQNFASVFEGLRENIHQICHYGFTEMVNNAIDHSNGLSVAIRVRRNVDTITISILDDGVGIFKKIHRDCNLANEAQALFELTKGKLTTDPQNHSGEGIFFTSRVFDLFEIHTKNLKFSHDTDFEFDLLSEEDSLLDNKGTWIYMRINRDSSRQLKEVFDNHTSGPDDFNFNKTIIPVRLASYENEYLVSRSQAKRLLLRVEKFQNVIFDFKGVPTVGQAFADEIFRVYAARHPQIVLVPVHMSDSVTFMVNRALGHEKS
jgi:anti-sigma regulatory factor (Ser/Thr protein kinase)